ncbi:ATP-binding protein [uncultured Shewanella sp.]|uniref:ATP-binding protein n=1 Tax=uncultured Shewanella sp. TaxID=173975 RepID=UPI00261CC3B1|nr:ATP-binding protein [uncultured Shewanella sp.]
MTPSESILLPSQEALLLRLQHISLYGDQLILLMGEQGSGKTTMITALLDTLEDHSLALITCPQYCDSHEIRRKILIQLLNDPIFDDELALPDSLLQAAQSLPKALCIVIDDADYLPHEIWNECLALIQLSLPNTDIRVVCTANNALLSSLSTQVSAIQTQSLLPMSISPLPLVERQSLYNTLLSLNGQGACIDIDSIFEKLSAQSGTPAEVLALFELSKQNEEELVSSDPKASAKVMPKWMSLTLVTAVVFVVSVTAMGLWMLKLPIDGQDNSALLTPKPLDPVPNLQSITTVNSQKEWDFKADKAWSVDHDEGMASVPLKVEKRPVERAMKSDEPIQAEILTNSGNEQELKEGKKAAVESGAEQPLIVWPTLLSIRPTQGYTLQLANVTKIETLYRLLTRVKDVKDLSIARYNKGWLVLAGQFDEKEFANKSSLYLIEKYNINKPWVRRWADLRAYELQVSVPSREIQ